MESVRERGDAAVNEFTSKFDHVTQKKCVFDIKDLPDPVLAAEVRAAFDVAYENIRAFHTAQLGTETSLDVETMPGVRCRRVSRAIGAVGLYVPGGSAVLPSTALVRHILRRFY